ncbi:zinc finger, CCHC-type containing protein [Tanacetum coccineum]|uniref:Zinc finger, CCHC-type containing protein n=1 Tax=Tanacetum coccineum TaxID=301880 RepID=A0ABQ5E658_9ASTR
MKFLLTAFKVYYVLEGPPIGVMTEKEQRKREQDETLCRGYILKKYTAEKERADKFITFKFFEFAMEDNMSILDQVHEFLILVSKFKNLNIEIPKKLLVGAIVTKLPSSWHNYRKKLMHTSENFTLDQIQKHLRIEKETRIREKNLNGASSSKVNFVDSGKNNKGNDKKRKGHIKRYCKNPKKKNQNSNKKDGYANALEQVDTTEFTAMVSEMNIGMIQELHMASVTTTDDWWYDSGATTHVIGSGNMEIQFTIEKKLTLMNVLHVSNIRKNLVFGFKLCKSGVKAVIESNKVILSKANVFVGKAYACDGMTTPYTPQQNGVAEGKNIVLQDMINAIIIAKKLKVSPYEIWKGRQPNISYFRVWGCLAYYKVLLPNTSKLGRRGLKSVFVGYAKDFKSYRCLDLDSNVIVESRDVDFFENKFRHDSTSTSEIVTQIPQDIYSPGLNSFNKRNMTESSSAPRKSKRAKKERNLDPDFINSQAIIFLVKGDNENNVVNKIPVLLNVEDAPKTYKEAITSRNSAF